MYTSLSKMWKQASIFIPSPNESSPVVYNGQLLAIATPRNGFTPVSIDVYDYLSGAKLSSKPWSGIFGTATTDDNGVIHIWGASAGSGTANSLLHGTLDANFTPSAPDVVYQYPAVNRVWNTSVCKGADGWYMALETLYPETLPTDHGFHIIFYKAASPGGPWTPYTNCFNYNPNPPYQRLFDAYCPTLKFVNGWFYLFFMQGDGQTPLRYNTFVAKSQALQPGSWTFGKMILTADGPGNEGTNASDFDYIEFQGACWGVYFSGDQNAGPVVKRSMYRGTEVQLIAECF